MNHHQIHTAVEIIDSAFEKTGQSLKAAKAIAASEAFRKYNWLKNAPVHNVSGSFRGMVVSSRWSATYHFAEDVAGPVEKVAIFASLAANLAKSYHEVERILQSNSDWGTKSAQLSSQVSSISIRTLGGVIPGTAHLLAMSVEGYCQIAGLMGVRQAGGYVDKLKAYDARLITTFDRYTDGDNIYVMMNSLVLK